MTSTHLTEALGEAGRRELQKLRADMGKVVLAALEDPKTVEVMLNPDGRLWQERFGEPLRQIGTMPSWQAEALIRTVAALLKSTVTRENPLVEGHLPLNGERFAGQLPPIVSAPCFAIRKPASAVFPLEDYVASGVMTQAQADALREAIRDHRNLLVAGATLSGKTTFVNAIIDEIVRQFPNERLLILEDTEEIQCAAIDSVQYLTSAEVSMTRLVRMTLRMRPDRILVSEVRGPEALDMLDLWNTGHPGGVCTLHANNARSALTRLRSLVNRNPEAPREIEPLIGETQPIVVHLCRDPECGRRVREILEVTGYGPDGYQTKNL
jgi:P-type conjugative transfer ATPase TrbB